MAGWIKLHRKLLSWEWFSEPNTLSVFVYLLLSANRKAAKWRGMDIQRGQHVTSVSKISEATGQTIRQTRTALDRLKTTSEIAIETTNRFSLITLVNWELYQGMDEIAAGQAAHQTASERQTNDKQNDTPSDNKQEVKEIKNEKKYKESAGQAPPPAPKPRKSFTPPTVEEVTAYCRERGNLIDPEHFCDYYITRGWVLSNGKKMADWKGAVRTWEKRDRGAHAGPASSPNKGNPFFDYARELEAQETEGAYDT